MPRAEPAVDAASFDEPVAVQTSWSPAKSGGASFRTHHLVPTHGDRIESRMSLGAKLFAGLSVQRIRDNAQTLSQYLADPGRDVTPSRDTERFHFTGWLRSFSTGSPSNPRGHRRCYHSPRRPPGRTRARARGEW